MVSEVVKSLDIPLDGHVPPQPGYARQIKNGIRSVLGENNIAFRCLDLANHYRRAVSVPDAPHMDEASREEFSKLLGRSQVYLEYGSGGSTLWAVRRNISRIVSVENDARFVAAMREHFSGSSANIDLMHCSTGLTGGWGRPFDIRRTQANMTRWQNYATAPWQQFHESNEYPDTILIDGRFRVNTVLTSMLELPQDRDAVFFMDDYKPRPEYHVLEPLVSNMRETGRAVTFTRPSDFDREKLLALQAEYVCDFR